MEETISLQEIVEIIRKRLLLIIIFFATGIGISAGINYYVLTPIYQVQTQILVNQNSSPGEAYSWQTTETDLQLINTYNVIITSPVILTSVIEALELDITPGQLTNQITVSSESNSKVVNISVEDSNPLLAVEISNKVAEVFKEQIPKLMSVDNITILSAAKLGETQSPVKPNKILNMAIAGVVGLMLGVGLAFILEISDKTLRNEKDVEEILGLPVMGVIGLIAEVKENKPSIISSRVRRN